MRILVDMDDTLSAFYERFFEIWRERHPDKLYIPLEQRTTFYIKEQYPKELHPLIEEIYLGEGFCLSLPAYGGGVEAVKEMKGKGHDVFICTAPLMPYHNCVLEKYQWVEKHFGYDWTKRTILTKDKTTVAADILIDDKPEITGVAIPLWEHILYDQPYNRHITDKRRLTWDNWREVLKI